VVAIKKASRKTTKAKKAATKKGSATKEKSASKKPATAKNVTTARKRSPAKKTGSDTVIIDLRSGQGRRTTPDRRKKSAPMAKERRQVQRRAKVARRRQIDPTTCERDYKPDEIEFMNALEEYKRVSGRMFPTCSEVLEVIKKLGYEKRPILEPSNYPILESDAEPSGVPLAAMTAV